MSSPLFVSLPAPYQSLPKDSRGNSPPPSFQTQHLAQQGRKTPVKQIPIPLTHKEWQPSPQARERGPNENFSSAILTESNLVTDTPKLHGLEEEDLQTPDRSRKQIQAPNFGRQQDSKRFESIQQNNFQSRDESDYVPAYASNLFFASNHTNNSSIPKSSVLSDPKPQQFQSNEFQSIPGGLSSYNPQSYQTYVNPTNSYQSSQHHNFQNPYQSSTQQPTFLAMNPQSHTQSYQNVIKDPSMNYISQNLSPIQSINKLLNNPGQPQNILNQTQPLSQHNQQQNTNNQQNQSQTQKSPISNHQRSLTSRNPNEGKNDSQQSENQVKQQHDPTHEPPRHSSFQHQQGPINTPHSKYPPPQFGQKNPFQKNGSKHSGSLEYDYTQKRDSDPSKKNSEPDITPPRKKYQQMPVQLQLHDQQSVVDLDNDTENISSKRSMKEKDEVIKNLVKQLQEKSRQIQEKDEQLKMITEVKQQHPSKQGDQQLIEQNRQLKKQLNEKEEALENILKKLNNLQDLYQKEIQQIYRKNQMDSGRQSERINDLEMTRSELQEQVEQLQTELQNKDDHIHDLKRELDNLHNNNHETLNQNKNLKHQIDQLLRQLQEIEQTDLQLEQTMANLTADNKTLQHELKNLSEVNKNITNDRQLQDMELEKSKMLIELQQTEIESLLNQNKELQRHIHELNQVPNHRAQDIEKQLHQLSDRLDQLKSHNDTEADIHVYQVFEFQSKKDDQFKSDINNQLLSLVTKKRDQMQSFRSICQEIAQK